MNRTAKARDGIATVREMSSPDRSTMLVELSIAGPRSSCSFTLDQALVLRDHLNASIDAAATAIALSDEMARNAA